MTRDISQLSDQELLNIIGEQPIQQPIQPDISQLSDQELQQIAVQPQERGFMQRAGEFLGELGPGLGELGVGAFQAGAELLGREDISQRVGEQLARERAELTPTQRAGRAAGQIVGTLPVGAGLGPVVGGVVGGGALSTLTPTEEGTLRARGEQAALGAAVGGIASKIIPGIGGAAKKAKQLGSQAVRGIKSRSVEQLSETTNALKNRASNLYDRMRNVNAVLRDETSAKIATNIDDALVKSGKLNPRLHGDTMAIVDDIKQATQQGQLDIEELDQFRQLLNDVVRKNTDAIKGANPDALKANIAIDQVDDIVENLKPVDLIEGGEEVVGLLNRAREEWGIFRKFQRISDLVEQADGDANRMKSVMQRFVSKKKNLRGFTKDEVDALRFAAENSTGEKLLKSLGKFGIDAGSSLTPGNTFLPAASVFTGIMQGNLMGGTGVVAAGTMARQAQKLVARGKVEDALNLIQAGGREQAADIISKIPNKSTQRKLINRLIGLSAVTATTQGVE